MKPSDQSQWKKAHSNSKNMDYYYSIKNMKECYWKVSDMPEYWCFFLDERGDRKLFNIVTGEKKENNTQKPIIQPPVSQSQTNNNAIPKSSFSQPSKPSFTPNNNRSGNSTNVASHYNKIQSLDREEREESKIKHLRQVNNLIKTSLIQKYCPKNENATVLDLACGKGGDMGKWNFNRIKKYVGIDIASESVKNAIERFKASNWEFKCRFAICDLGKFDINNDSDFFNEYDAFDCISMQFALHYLFESEESINLLFKTVSRRLKKDKYFIGTISDGNAIIRLIRNGFIDIMEKGKEENKEEKEEAQENEEKNEEEEEENEKKVEKIYSFSNDVCSIEMNEENYQKQWKMKLNPFGVRYKFTLLESVEGLDEFVVVPQLLKEIGEKYNLKLILSENLNDYFYRILEDEEIIKQIEKKSIFDRRGSIGYDEWNAIHMYRVFVFQKVESESDSSIGLFSSMEDSRYKGRNEINFGNIEDFSNPIY